MNYYPYLLCCLLLAGLLLEAPAQEARTGLSPLAPGDTLPPLRLEGVINHPTGAIRLEEYRGRWLILDFWATWCAPCIGMFPKADSLERRFKGALAILPVTYQGAEAVKLAFEKRKLLQGLKPAIVTADHTLRQLFPHQELPHYVWVDPQGVVRSITGPDEVNAERIRALLQAGGSAAALRQKQDQFLPFGRYDTLSTLNPLLPDGPAHYSATLTGYVEGLNPFYAYQQPTAGKGGRILMTNHSLLGLYRQAYSTGTTYYGLNRVHYEVADRDRLENFRREQDYGDWLRQGNGYCYELQVPPALAGREWTLVQQDLDRLFSHYRARVERRTHPVLALVRSSRAEAYRSRGGAPSVQVSGYGARLQNATFNDLLMYLNAMYLQESPLPLVDLTGYTGTVDLVLEADMSDVAAVRSALQPYGLDLVEKKAKIPVLVIRESAAPNTQQ